MSSKTLPLRTRATVFHLIPRVRLLFYPHGISPSRGRQRAWSDLRSSVRNVDAPENSLSLPPQIDLSQMINPGTPPEHIVDAVRSLKPFLPIGYEVLGQGDLTITGSCPINAGGFANVWAGKMKDGTVVAVKSHRHYSSSSCLPVYLVSSKCYRGASRSLNITDRGYIRKR